MHQLGPVYEDPDAFKVDPHTQDNLAYGHVQQSAQLKGPIYEDIKPDPHTQGNTRLWTCAIQLILKHSESIVIVHCFYSFNDFYFRTNSMQSL